MAGESTELRKNLLVLRAAIERAEMVETVKLVRQGLRWTTLLRAAVPAVAARQGLPLLAGLIRRFPVVTSAVSVLTARLKPRLSLVGVLRSVAIAGLAWQVWQLVRSARRSRAQRGSGPARQD